MGKGKDLDSELSEMLRGAPLENILIAFDDKPAKTLAEHLKEQREKENKKKRKPRDDRER